MNPQHYVLANGHQVIEVSENLTSNGGQAVQYIARATRTDGVTKDNPVEDLKKAIWFIEREIGRITPAETLKSWTIEDLAKMRNQWWGQYNPEWKITIGSDWRTPPREWDNIEEVPDGVVVEDIDGDFWKWDDEGDLKFKFRWDTEGDWVDPEKLEVEWELAHPFTEVKHV